MGTTGSDDGDALGVGDVVDGVTKVDVVVYSLALGVGLVDGRIEEVVVFLGLQLFLRRNLDGGGKGSRLRLFLWSTLRIWLCEADTDKTSRSRKRMKIVKKKEGVKCLDIVL